MKIAKQSSKISLFVASTLCSILVLSMVSPVVESNKAFAIDHNYYVQQYVEVDNQLQKIITDTSAMEKQVSDLKKANVLTAKIQQLQQQIDANNNQRQSLVAELDHIQDENRALYKVDPATKKKLDDAQTVLDQKYLNRTSETYVGDNPVQEIAANYEYKNLWVSFDPDKTINNPSGDKSHAIITDIKKVAGDISLNVDYQKIRLVQCSTRDGVCSPLLGGDAIQASSKTFPCTEGYPASDASNNPGFIMAGHCGTLSATVNQPQPGKTGSRQVGTITAWNWDGSLTAPNFDFGFVKTSVSTSSFGIFKDGLALYAIIQNTPQRDQHIGDIVKKSGYGSNAITMGSINSIDSLHHIAVGMSAVGGDSGAPIFRDIDGTDVLNYGMAYAGNSAVTMYFPEDFINSQLGLH